MNNSQMLTKEVNDERAWRVDSIDDSAAWNYPLSGDYLSGCERIVREVRGRDLPVGEIPRQGVSLNHGGECLQPVLDALRSGRGFAIVNRVPVNGCAPDEGAVDVLDDRRVPWRPNGAEYPRNVIVRRP